MNYQTDYKLKYIKYKNKYLNLLNQYSGSTETNEIMIWNDDTKEFTPLPSIIKSPCAQHVLVRNEVLTVLGEIPDDEYILCLQYKKYKDTQIGITETNNKGETFIDCAIRGVFEECGIFVHTDREAIVKDTRANNDFQCYIIKINRCDHKKMLADGSIKFNGSKSKIKKKSLVLVHGKLSDIHKILSDRFTGELTPNMYLSDTNPKSIFDVNTEKKI